ncbi:hypothetical protein GW17_00029238 [Ensete ventricosum]|nr:hypothetical protein GW17_00029238 [Ensete ventricosum]
MPLAVAPTAAVAALRRYLPGGRALCPQATPLFNHDGEKELPIRHGPKIKLRHRAKDWTIRWEFARTSPKVSGISLGTRWEIAGGGP